MITVELKYNFFVATDTVPEYGGGFSYDGYDEEFIYTPLDSEVISYIKRTHSDEDIINDYIMEIYETNDAGWQDDFRNEFGIDEVTATSLLNSFVNKKEKDYFIKDAIEDLVNDTDIYYDELLDYFEADAEHEFQSNRW